MSTGISLTGKVAVVTGGSRGIGRAIAEMLCHEGAQVSICGRNEDNVRLTVDQLSQLNAGKAIGRQCDVRHYDQVRSFVDFTVAELGGVDILINNAGVALLGRVDEISPEVWREVIDTNLNGSFYFTHSIVPTMRERGGGYIINMSSRSGINAFPGGCAYNASKFGMIGLSEASLLDLRYDHIRVSYIMPGRVSTDLAGEKQEPWQLTTGDVAKVVRDLLTSESRALVSRVEIRPSEQPNFDVRNAAAAAGQVPAHG